MHAGKKKIIENKGPRKKNNRKYCRSALKFFEEKVPKLHSTTELFWHGMKASIGVNMNSNS